MAIQFNTGDTVGFMFAGTHHIGTILEVADPVARISSDDEHIEEFQMELVSLNHIEEEA